MSQLQEKEQRQTVKEWSTEEEKLFLNGLLKEKLNFDQIRTNFFPHKTTEELENHYTFLKKELVNNITSPTKIKTKILSQIKQTIISLENKENLHPTSFESAPRDPNKLVPSLTSYHYNQQQQHQNQNQQHHNHMNSNVPHYLPPPQTLHQNYMDEYDPQPDDRLITTQDLKKVQVLVERCLHRYLTRDEASVVLMHYSGIDPFFTNIVWKKLEEQNPVFFRDYYMVLAKQRS
eukprot:TRINITY_DN16349_c0_g1_i1.p1 TRINITY_DN16349_c0_g1~~TRINITY_DN16349_c0_g1_i1.p1  ORF type:complete len:233 (+),score=72.93 TRINITY_DN16349_c0_g1_i1:111-809(+)